MDRRIQVTQQKLVGSLRVLMQKYPWESITIAVICQESEVSRSTFYSHFSSKEELMQFSLGALAQELAPADTRRGLAASGTLKFLPALLQHIKSHRNIIVKNADSAAAGLIQQNMRKTIEGLASKEIQSSSYASAINDDTLVFVCGGLMAIIERWSDNGCSDSVASVVAIIDTQIKRTINHA